METRSDAPRDAVTLGLTTAETATQAKFRLRTVTKPDGSRCIALEGIEGKVTDHGATVLIDRSYRHGACQYDAVLAHEREHVRINADATRRIGRLLDERLKDIVQRWGRRWLMHGDTRPIEQEVENAIAEASRLARKEADRRHRAIDTPEAYAEVQARCDSW